MATVLDFEKPIEELEQKVAQLKEFSETHDVDVSSGLSALNDKIEQTKKRIFSELTPIQRVQLARHPDRPYPRDYVNEICSDFVELHGDRRYSNDKAIFGGFAKFNGQKVVVIGTQKGRSLEENMEVNFGSAHPEGYRKALRIMQLADKYRLPIISLIDTPGAYPGIGAEERHIAEAIATNLRTMFTLRVPIVVAVVGEGGSGGALGIGVGDRLLLMEHAYYSVITPEGCAAILWRDGAKKAEAAEALKLTSSELKNLNLTDEVITEPLGGAHREFNQAAKGLAEALDNHLQDLQQYDDGKLCKQRYQKYRQVGAFQETE